MSSLTPENSHADFVRNLEHITDTFYGLAERLSATYRKAPNNDWRLNNSSFREIPSKDDYLFSYVLPYTMLSHIVEKIGEEEEFVDSLMDDDNAESDELAHAQGVLFASKQLYISTVTVIGQVETERMRFFAGMGDFGDFTRMALHSTVGLPEISDQIAPAVPEILTSTDDSNFFRYTRPSYQDAYDKFKDTYTLGTF